ncbi:hypothetical protein EMIT0324P_220008 [Pseudomonas chlororaphis]
MQHRFLSSYISYTLRSRSSTYFKEFTSLQARSLLVAGQPMMLIYDHNHMVVSFICLSKST